MLKRIPAGRAKQLIDSAGAAPASDPRVTYPSWYLHRWHFLPEGYLSGRCAAGYDHIIRRVYNQGFERRAIRAAADLLQGVRPGAVLEVGCGPGRMLEELARREFASELVGVDLSPYLLERARRRLRPHHVRLVHADGLALPSEDEAFDAVVAAHYVGHLPTAVRADAAVEFARVIRPGGHAVVIEHHWHPWPETSLLLRDRTVRLNAGLIDITTFVRTDVTAESARA
jgi:ubiquinone/menaquinone biosynthesis C-methylase UbiE